MHLLPVRSSLWLLSSFVVRKVNLWMLGKSIGEGREGGSEGGEEGGRKKGRKREGKEGGRTV